MLLFIFIYFLFMRMIRHFMIVCIWMNQDVWARMYIFIYLYICLFYLCVHTYMHGFNSPFKIEVFLYRPDCCAGHPTMGGLSGPRPLGHWQWRCPAPSGSLGGTKIDKNNRFT